MSDTTVHISILLRDLREGSPGAVRALIDRAHPRLRALAAKVLRESFPTITAVEVDEVVSEAYPRLVKALEAIVPPTPADFFRLAAHKIRQTLLDLAAAYRRRKGFQRLDPVGGSSGGLDVPESTEGPPGRPIQTEIHEHVEGLPEDVKAVFVPVFYLGLTQAEVAEATGLPARQVSRLWRKALLILGDLFTDPPADGPAGHG